MAEYKERNVNVDKKMKLTAGVPTAKEAIKAHRYPSALPLNIEQASVKRFMPPGGYMERQSES